MEISAGPAVPPYLPKGRTLSVCSTLLRLHALSNRGVLLNALSDGFSDALTVSGARNLFAFCIIRQKPCFHQDGRAIHRTKYTVTKAL
jgi:hypothetical protein